MDNENEYQAFAALPAAVFFQADSMEDVAQKLNAKIGEVCYDSLGNPHELIGYKYFQVERIEEWYLISGYDKPSQSNIMYDVVALPEYLPRMKFGYSFSAEIKERLGIDADDDAQDS